MSTFVEDVYTFNKEAGLLEGGLDTFMETAYQMEELLEGFEAAFNTERDDGTPIVPGDKDWINARQLSLSFVNQILDAFSNRKLPLPSEVEEFDKSIDSIYFHIGKLSKMRLTPDLIEEGFKVVHKANMSKLSAKKDEHGKQLKPEDWTGPDAKLQAILDKREPIKKALDEPSK